MYHNTDNFSYPLALTQALDVAVMAATLSDLPVEIFDMIIDYMCAVDHGNASGRLDITNLRLVDRTIETKTKVRFAREGFHTLVLQVPIVWDKRLQYVLRDPIFRNSVRCVAICPGLAQFPLEGGPEEKHAANYVFNGRFRTELRRIMEAHPSVTKVVALSFWLWAYGRSVSEDIKRVEGYWGKVVTEALAALSTTENVRPTKLILDNSTSQISSFVIRAMLNVPTFVNQLSRLRLSAAADVARQNKHVFMLHGTSTGVEIVATWYVEGIYPCSCHDEKPSSV
jgi:hypothetical protein